MADNAAPPGAPPGAPAPAVTNYLTLAQVDIPAFVAAATAAANKPGAVGGGAETPRQRGLPVRTDMLTGLDATVLC
jgi:hypothetical protein